MGSPTTEPGRGDNEGQHQVTLTRFFYLSDHEVTQTEWQAVMGWNDSEFRGANRPVEHVTWFDCIKYCNLRSAMENLDSFYVVTERYYEGVHLTDATVTIPSWDRNGYRLPTEGEWEYACRSGRGTAFCNGPIVSAEMECSRDPNLDLVGWYCHNSSDTTHDVKGKQPNGRGLYDMHGNVWEWCWDFYSDYPSAATDPTGPEWDLFGHILRGGCWRVIAQLHRSACRQAYYLTSNEYADIGMRLCRTAP